MYWLCLQSDSQKWIHNESVSSRIQRILFKKVQSVTYIKNMWFVTIKFHTYNLLCKHQTTCDTIIIQWCVTSNCNCDGKRLTKFGPYYSAWRMKRSPNQGSVLLIKIYIKIHVIQLGFMTYLLVFWNFLVIEAPCSHTAVYSKIAHDILFSFEVTLKCDWVSASEVTLKYIGKFSGV